MDTSYLDDGAPELVSYSADEGILTLTVKDTQSGIDYANLYAKIRALITINGNI